MWMCFVMLSLAACKQVVPIPTAPEGYFVGPSQTNYTLEVFMDHLCAGCKIDWPGLTEYWNSTSAWLELAVHIFPLPYHTYSFLISQAGKYVIEQRPEQYFNFIEEFFKRQDKYLDQAQYLTWNEIKHEIAVDTATATGAPYGQVLEALDSSYYKRLAAVSWAYGCSRGVSATPTYFVNGVWVPEATLFNSSADWTTFFNELP